MLTYWAFRIGTFVASFVPLWLGYPLATLAAELSYVVCSGTRANVKANLRRALGPQVDEATLARYARGVFKTGLKNYYELLVEPHLSAQHFVKRIRVHGLENLDAALAKGRGAIIVSAHFGSYEFTAQILAVRKYRVLVPAEPLRPQKLFDLVSRLRSSHGLTLIPAERSQMRQIVRWLRGNGIVGYPVDRDAIGGGRPFEFFGFPAPLQPAAVALARREGCPVVPLFAVRRADNTTDLFVEQALEMQRTDDEEADTKANMRAILRHFERYIRAYPDQWVAFVPVWKGTEGTHGEQQTAVESHEPVGQSRPSHS